MSQIVLAVRDPVSATTRTFDQDAVLVGRAEESDIVLADRVATGPRGEAFHARLPMTGELMEFLLEDIEWFQVLRNEG